MDAVATDEPALASTKRLHGAERDKPVLSVDAGGRGRAWSNAICELSYEALLALLVACDDASVAHRAQLGAVRAAVSQQAVADADEQRRALGVSLFDVASAELFRRASLHVVPVVPPNVVDLLRTVDARNVLRALRVIDDVCTPIVAPQQAQRRAVLLAVGVCPKRGVFDSANCTTIRALVSLALMWNCSIRISDGDVDDDANGGAVGIDLLLTDARRGCIAARAGVDHSMFWFILRCASHQIHSDRKRLSTSLPAGCSEVDKCWSGRKQQRAEHYAVASLCRSSSQCRWRRAD